MHLVSSLSAGVSGAPLGSASIYRRGTSTRATLYASFEGDLHPENGSAVSLDSYGRALVYVNELVDVQVVDSDGLSVIDFTEGDASGNIEVRSLSFTGRDYDSGQTGVGKPTTVQAILDAVETSFGASDWKVDVDGTPKNLSIALASILGIFINVKDPTYGAEGDGVVDDTAAIQAALTAAGTPKSIVFFPAGTYRITSALTVPVGVSLWGVGPLGSSIKIDHGTANTLVYGAGTSVGYQEIRGLDLEASQANTGDIIQITNAGTRYVAVINCYIGFVNSNGTSISVDGNSHRVLIDGSDVRVSGSAEKCVDTVLSQATVELRNSRFICIGSTYAESMVSAVILNAVGCTFDLSSKNSGAASCIHIYGNTGVLANVAVNGCSFIPGTGGNSYALNLDAFATGITGTSLVESGNIFRQGFTRIWFGWAQTTATPVITQGSREQRESTATDNTATVDCLADECGVFVLTRTNNSAQAITTDLPSVGAKFTFCVYNNSGGALGTVSFSTGFATGTPSITALANGKLATYHFQAVYLAGGLAMVPLGAYTTVL